MYTVCFAVWFASLVVGLSLIASACKDHPESAVVESVRLAFTDITEQAGLGGLKHETGAFGKLWFPETNGGAVAFFDYNSDGYPDILWQKGGGWPEFTGRQVNAMELFLNRGDGTFTNITRQAGLADVVTYPFGYAIADYDNDGDQDIFQATLYEDQLFRNDNGVFTEIGKQAGFARESDWGSSAIFFDADLDGFPDLYVGNYVEWSPETDQYCAMGTTKAYCTPQTYRGTPGRYYHNNGDGTFTDMTEKAGFADSPGKSLGVADLDYNKDGYPDLIVANDTERALLYENNRNNTFTEKGLMAGVALGLDGRARSGMGVDTGDMMNNGEEAIVIGHFSQQMTGVYVHQGGGLFEDISGPSRIGQAALLRLTFGLFLADMNLDGYLDLFLSHGHIDEAIEKVQDGIGYRQQQQLMINQGDGTFEDVSPRLGPPFDQAMVARGVAYADIERDGDLDVLIGECGGPPRLWRNDLKGGKSVRVYVEGQESGTNGLGVSITAVVGTRRITRRVKTGGSYISQSELPLTIGLGESEKIDTLLVRWPRGAIHRYADIQAGSEIRIVEGSQSIQRVPLKKQ